MIRKEGRNEFKEENSNKNEANDVQIDLSYCEGTE